MIGVLIKQRKLSDEVAAHLEGMIRKGELAEAERLPSERELMRQFGVGRPSIREALLHLSKMGLVEVKSGERARVTRPTPQFAARSAFRLGQVSPDCQHLLHGGATCHRDDQPVCSLANSVVDSWELMTAQVERAETANGDELPTVDNRVG